MNHRMTETTAALSLLWSCTKAGGVFPHRATYFFQTFSAFTFCKHLLLCQSLQLCGALFMWHSPKESSDRVSENKWDKSIKWIKWQKSLNFLQRWKKIPIYQEYFLSTLHLMLLLCFWFQLAELKTRMQHFSKSNLLMCTEPWNPQQQDTGTCCRCQLQQLLFFAIRNK